MKKQLFCGASKKLITPREDLLPYMMGLGGATFGKIQDELYVRVIAFSNGINQAMLVSFDLDKAPYPEENMKLLQEKTGTPADHILFFAIHTHTAPLTGYRPFEPKHDITGEPLKVQEAIREYEEFVRFQMIAAAMEAVESQRPAKLGYRYGSSYINVNRCQDYTMAGCDGREYTECGLGANGAGPVDHTAFVMKVEDMKGRPIAFFVNYAVHCVTMFLNDIGDGRSGISGDIGGNVSQYMEKRFEGTVAVWSSGAAGDINPVMMTQTIYPDADTGEPVGQCLGKLEDSCLILRAMAGRHFADVLQIVRNIKCDEAEVEIGSAIEWSRTPVCEDVLKNGQIRDENSSYGIRMHLLRIGQVALMGINGELYTTLGQKIKEVSPMKHTIIINHESSLLLDNPGYILDDETICRCQAGQGGRIPVNGFCGVLDTIAASLKNHTKIMFERILCGNCLISGSQE